MNSTQKFYDSAFCTIIGAQQLNPFYYFKSLKLINSRKTQYPSFDKFNIKKVSNLPYKDHFVIESNKKYKEKISLLRQKPVIPKINSVFLELDNRIKNNKFKIKNNEKRALTLENTKYNIRVRNQKPKILKAEYLKKMFIQNHDKYLELLLRPMKIRANKMKKNQKSYNFRTRLPNISQTSTDGFYSKGRYKTDISSTNEQSNENSLELKEHKRHEIIHGRPNHNY